MIRQAFFMTPGMPMTGVRNNWCAAVNSRLYGFGPATGEPQ